LIVPRRSGLSVAGCLAVVVASLVPAAVMAGDDFLAAHGYSVGSMLDSTRVIKGGTSDKALLRVKAGDASSERVYVGLAADGKTVARILTEEDTADRNACARRLGETARDLRGRFPKIAFYALDDADMYYLDERIANLACVAGVKGVIFRVDRWDERLLAK